MPRPFEGTFVWRVLEWISSKIDLTPDKITPLVAVQYGFSNTSKPDWKAVKVQWGKGAMDSSLYWNGLFFFRVMRPFFIGFSFRWSPSSTKKALLQTHFGWKLNGEFGLVFRVQSDESSARGFTGPNSGQATGWNDGPH